MFNRLELKRSILSYELHLDAVGERSPNRELANPVAPYRADRRTIDVRKSKWIRPLISNL